uniref:Uncharacterized protein n=1 Tax=mine drainage metagenome TaxID=410659 RepID=E6PY56_9ZZZZ
MFSSSGMIGVPGEICASWEVSFWAKGQHEEG